jgi:hypothetical protein
LAPEVSLFLLPFRGHSVGPRGKGIVEGQNVAQQPSDLWQSGLPRRSRCGEGGSKSVKLNQSDFFAQKAGPFYANTFI